MSGWLWFTHVLHDSAASYALFASKMTREARFAASEYGPLVASEYAAQSQRYVDLAEQASSEASRRESHVGAVFPGVCQ